ncbi:MAG: flagellar type III secretion system pore protein FliP [Ahrensia sp.]|nr:flagellar type III secretion system pore protein FliP [Ahrensia sp.]
MTRLVLLIAVLLFPAPAAAQVPDLSNILPQTDGQAAGNIVRLIALITVLSLAPGILIVVTSFTRFIIAFSILRMGLGLQTTPANLILISLALFMTFHVMSPTLDRAWNEGVSPLTRGEITEAQAFTAITQPFREFMLKHVREQDLEMFISLSEEVRNEEPQENIDIQQVDLRALIPAFMISEIKRGFEIGFLILLPFLAIDLIVATITMAMGMMMLPPTVVSLPFKILFFILIDGWTLLVGSMVRSFG